MAEAAALMASATRHLSGANPLVTFPTTGGGSWQVWYRFLALRGESVFEIGNVCGTCEFWFRRLEAGAEPIDIDAVQQSLTNGLTNADGEAVEVFASLLQSGTYRIALLSLVPERVMPGSSADYFTNEQESAWPEFEEEGPNDPNTSYYRVVGRSGVTISSNGDSCFEFLVPLQIGDALDPVRIAFFEDELQRGATPTAIAVGVLDIKQYYDSPTAHWCLSHYLLDGHHKVEAAARTRKPVTLLSFITCDHGVASAEDIDRLLASYGREGLAGSTRPQGAEFT